MFQTLRFLGRFHMCRTGHSELYLLLKTVKYLFKKFFWGKGLMHSSTIYHKYWNLVQKIKIQKNIQEILVCRTGHRKLTKFEI